MRSRSSVRLGVALVVAVLAPSAVVNSQEPATKPEPPERTLWRREELTGDWGGVRQGWKDKGIVLNSSLTQFYQGLASGGIDPHSEYNGTLQSGFKLDLDKLAGLRYWAAEIRGEMRFGGPSLGRIGGVSTVNTAAIIPGSDGTVFAITALNFTRLFPVDLKKGNAFAVSLGRYNLIDIIDEDFHAGDGIERFMNIAQIGPMTVLRQVPLITNTVNLAYIRKSQPFISLVVLDPNDHSTNPGLDDLFADGVTFFPSILFPAKYFAKTAKHSVGGAITTKKYTPFDAIRQIILPGPPVNPIQARPGSWSVNYTFRQYIVERGKRDGWGFFTQVSFADRATSPITAFFDLGLAGNGLFKKRQGDEFGIAYAYTDLSPDLKDNLDLLPLGGRLRAELQLELFYNLHITPWLQLTGDLQIIRPNRPIAETAVVPAARLRVVF